MLIKFKFSLFVFVSWPICLYRIRVGKCQVYTLATLGVFLDRDVDAYKTGWCGGNIFLGLKHKKYQV